MHDLPYQTLGLLFENLPIINTFASVNFSLRIAFAKALAFNWSANIIVLAMLLLHSQRTRKVQTTVRMPEF